MPAGNNHGRLTIAVALGDDEHSRKWEYSLTISWASRGTDDPSSMRRSSGMQEYRCIAHRRDRATDPELATQTALEQVSANRKFREVADFLSEVKYLHLVPQIVRDPTRGGLGHNDPFAGSFLAEIGQCPKRDFERRRKILTEALQLAVPQFDSLDRHQWPDGTWHLQARYKSFRPHASAQDERDFSDGTLRLIALLWVLLDRSGSQAPILLEEPELSLHAEIVRQLPTIMASAIASSRRQVIASSHGAAILEDPSVSASEVLLLNVMPEGTKAYLASSDPMVVKLIEGGSFTLYEALQADLVRPEMERLMTLKMV